jgi:dUTP pyrophosphatase
MTFQFAKIDPSAFAPTRKFPTDAGVDLYALDSVIVNTGKIKIIRTGVKVKIPKGCVGLFWPKGRSDFLICGGVIDESYQGEMVVKIFNSCDYQLVIKRGEPVAQLLIMPIITEPVEELKQEDLFPEKTERGETGGIHVPKGMYPDLI